MAIPETVEAPGIYAGDTWVWELEFYRTYDQRTDTWSDPIDLTQFGDQWAAQMRRNDLVVDFTIDSSAAADGKLTLSLTAAETLAITSWSQWRYDLQATAGASVLTLIRGPIEVDGDVTRV